MTQPLAGLKVLEVAQFAAGPFPALLLADFGADVVKIEPPGGDGFRNWPPQVDSGDGEPYGISFAVLNRNKRSVVLDLKNAGDRARFLALCAKADVLVENNRPGAMERLGLSFADVRQGQPKTLGSRHPRNAPYRAFEASDKSFVIAAGTDGLWHKVCDVVGRPALKEDARFATVARRADQEPALSALLQPIFRQRTAAEWLSLFESSGVPCAPVYDYAEVCEDVHVKQSGILCSLVLPGSRSTLSIGNPLRMTDYSFQVTRNPPGLGEHGADVFKDWA